MYFKATPKVRRVRYIRPKSTVKVMRSLFRELKLFILIQIFDSSLDWTTDRKIDSRNDEAMKKIRRGPSARVFDEQLSWSAKPKIDSHNEDALDTHHRFTRSLVKYTYI